MTKAEIIQKTLVEGRFAEGDRSIVIAEHEKRVPDGALP